MINFRTNISQFIRDLGAMTRGENSIYQAGGRELRDFLFEEFTDLVRETPQFSGSTAASWEIGFPGSVSEDGDYVKLPKPADGVEAARAGDKFACDKAINKAFTTLMGADPEAYISKDLLLINNAPGFETAEHGPVRAENEPPGPGAMERFVARIESAGIIDKYRKP